MSNFRLIAAIAFAFSAINAANAADGTQAVGQMLATSFYQQIKRCWNPPIPSNRHGVVVVRLDVHLNVDGQVAAPPRHDSQLDISDPYVHAAAEAATRAVYSCAPYKLPAARYQEWQEIEVVFDPRNLD